MAYLNVIEIESALQNLAAAYREITELVEAPHLSHEGRQVHILRIGTKSAAEVDGILILGGVHAREWVPPDALVSLAADLLEAHALGTGLGYGNKKFSVKDVRRIIESLNLFVCGCVNPDGRHHSQTNDPLWRKNRRPHPGGGNCVGVDLNRNFDFLWDHLTKFAPDSQVSASDDPCDRNVYRGPSAASEPEVRNVVWLLDTYPRIHWLLDVHSAVPVILHNWGSDQNQTTEPSQTFLNSAFDGVRGRVDGAYGEYITPDDLEMVETLGTRMNDAVKAVRGIEYGVEQAYGLYPTSGASDDYAFSRHIADPSKTKVYGFTIECGSSFQPTWSEAEEVIREVSAGSMAFCLGVAGE
jgi:murein tripeptide amidase MpaA